MNLYYRSYGQPAQSSLLVLHGLFGSSDNWHSFSKVMGEHFHVSALDARNHGQSPHDEVFDYPSMANDVVEFIRYHQLQSSSLLGHSMGGKTAMLCALQHPELIDKLIVVDIAPRAYPPHHDQIFDALSSLHLAEFTSRKDIDDALAQKITHVDLRQFLLKNIAHNVPGSFYWKMNFEGIKNNYQNIMTAIPEGSRYEGPALFIRGEHSDYIEMSDVAAIGRLFPRAELITIKNAGHWIHTEAPEAFQNTVADFLLS